MTWQNGYGDLKDGFGSDESQSDRTSSNAGTQRMGQYSKLSATPQVLGQPFDSSNLETQTTYSPWTSSPNYALILLESSTAQLSLCDRAKILARIRLTALLCSWFPSVAVVSLLVLGMWIWSPQELALRADTSFLEERCCS